MSNISTLSLNLLLEQVYLEGHINLMYEEILREDDNMGDKESKSMIKKVIDDLKLNADFMFTYGVGISAFVSPINELLTNGGIRLTHYDVVLLVITAFYVLVTKSAEDIDKLVARVKEHKLESELKKVVKFVSGTVGLFKIVGSKVGVTVTTLIDVLAFTFMSVPVLNLIKNLAAEKGFSIDNVGQLFAGLTLSAGAYLLKNILKKRLKESEEDSLEWAQDTIKPFQGVNIPTELTGINLYELIQHIFTGTRFSITVEGSSYELVDASGTYCHFYRKKFTVENIRRRLFFDIKEISERNNDQELLQDYIDLYEVLKPVLFNDEPYTNGPKKKPNIS